MGAYDRFAGLSGTTFRQLGASTGIPLELLVVVREAVGFAEPGPEDTVREDELSVVPLIQLQLAKGFRPVVVGRWLRAYGGSLRRIAETEAAWWNSEVEMALLASGMTEGEMLDAQADLGSQVTPSPTRPWRGDEAAAELATRLPPLPHSMPAQEPAPAAFHHQRDATCALIASSHVLSQPL